MTDETSFDQPIKNDQITYVNIRKIGTGQEDDYTTDCLLDYLYFKENYMLIVIGLSKPQKLAADPKGIKQINFIGNLENNAESKKQKKKQRKQF